jgi:hypothetical protein
MISGHDTKNSNMVDTRRHTLTDWVEVRGRHRLLDQLITDKRQPLAVG